MLVDEKVKQHLLKQFIRFFLYYTFYVFLFFLFSHKSQALDPRYYYDQYDEADRAYFLEEERKEQEERKRLREEKKKKRAGVSLDKANYVKTSEKNVNTKNKITEKESKIFYNNSINNDVKINQPNSINEENVSSETINSSFLQHCSFDMKKFCQLKRKHKNYELKSAWKCQKKLTKNWAYLQPSCQVFLSGIKDARNINRVNYYIGNGIKISQTTAEGKVIKKPKRMKSNRK